MMKKDILLCVAIASGVVCCISSAILGIQLAISLGKKAVAFIKERI